MLTKLCSICSIPFFVKPYRFELAKYCSHACYGLSERGRVPKSAFKKGHHSSTATEFKRGEKHRYFGKVGPASGKRWGLSGQGARTIRLRIMATAEYRNWRKAVFQRDDYTCRLCKVRGGQLHADHIKPYRLFPELVFSLDNGRTLCVPCHRKTDTYGSRGKSPKKTSQ